MKKYWTKYFARKILVTGAIFWPIVLILNYIFQVQLYSCFGDMVITCSNSTFRTYQFLAKVLLIISILVMSALVVGVIMLLSAPKKQ
jgi:hypothetical protein